MPSASREIRTVRKNEFRIMAAVPQPVQVLK